MIIRYKWLMIFLMLAGITEVRATHYRAGEIIYQRTGNLTYRCSVITYSRTSSFQADREWVELNWGDGTVDTIARINGPVCSPSGIPCGDELPNDIKKNVYIGTHTYSGVPPAPNNFYVISFFDVNRMAGVVNIDNGNSVFVPFYVEDTLKFPNDVNNIGFNSSPILLNDPIDYANVNDTFYHNPNAFDPDGDSLTFELITPLQDLSTNVPLYLLPDQYCPTNDAFTINKQTGEIIWAVPCAVGIFNIAILVREFRNGVNMGTLIRDMQIIVLNEPNDPPQIAEFADTCIWAGDTLLRQVTATDPNAVQLVTLSAEGGPFQITPAATFNASQGNPATGNFRWITDCSHIRKQFYQVVFKAEDNYVNPGPGGGSPAPLVDLKTWRIQVIPPPVQNVTATATANSITVNWQNPYECASSPDFRGFSVWRKTGCDPFTPSYCETGLAARGYTKLTAANIFTYSYTDNATVVGQEYSYRVLAHFSKQSPNGVFQYDFVESVPSNEACVFMPLIVPVMLNVDVQQTDASNGEIFTRWSKPVAGGLNLDTLQNPPPYRFELYRGEGFNFNNQVLVYTSPNAASYSTIADTVFTDTGINTQDNPWSYRVLFYSANDTVGFSATASSVYLNVQPSDQSLFLTWQASVPWTNDSFSVFRLNKVTSVYDSIGIAYTTTYTDTGLTNDSTYCYFVKAYGHYEVGTFPRPLINKSQKDCAVPIDTLPPCPPVLSVRNDCPQFNEQPWGAAQFINYLSWLVTDNLCNEDIHHFNIYRADDSTGQFVLIDSTTSKGDTSFNHILQESLAGCYAVTAEDRIGNESTFSNIVCVDNCPYYLLPNTFTPNGDNANDVFRPFKPYRFVPKIEMRIFNRWGEEVFRTEDPEIGWNGKVNNTGADCNDGVYLYAGYYYEQRLNGLVKKPLSGQKKGGGFIHLIRGR